MPLLSRFIAVSFLTLILAISNVSAIYFVDFFNDGSGSPATVNVASFEQIDGTCEVDIEGYATMKKNTPPLSVTMTYYSPADDILISGSNDFSNNISCQSFGIFNTSVPYALTNTYEGRTIAIHTADILQEIDIRTRYSCDTGDDWLNISINNGTRDSRNTIPNLYYHRNTGATQTPQFMADFFDADSFGECKDLTPILLSPPVNIALPLLSYAMTAFYMPFNSSGTGQLVYDLDCTNCISTDQTPTQQAWYLYKLSDPTSLTLLSNGFTASGSSTLDINTMYVLMYYDRTFGGSGGNANINFINGINYSVFAHTPIWECGDWSECINSSQSRVCIDTTGKTTPRFEYRSCDITVLETATLGFEEFTNIEIKKCYPNWLVGCSYFINDTSTNRETPLNWTVVENANNRRDFLRMSQDWATEGTRSLKMWHIPPKEGEPVFYSPINATICSNQTVGTIPSVTQNVNNDTFTVDYNVTFPSSDMLISFDVKGCREQVLHHGEIRTLFDTILLCPEKCYALECNSTPSSRFFFNMVDQTTSQSVISSPYYGNADTNLAQTIRLDISNLGIVDGRNYTLSFGSQPENLNDQSGNCVYFDNVRYERIEEPFLDVLDGVCESKCVGDDFYVTRLIGGACSVTVEEFSPSCTSDANADSIENLEDYCIDTTTAAILNDFKAKYETVTCDFECVDGRCVTEEEAEPDAEFRESVDITEFINLVFSKFGIGLFFLLIGIGLVTGIAKSWQIGSISGLGILLFNVISQLWPVEYGLVVAAFILVLLAKFGGEAIMGGG